MTGMTHRDIVVETLWRVEITRAERPDLDRLARAGGVSRFHLTRAFSLRTGWSLMAYVRARRLSEAALQMRAGASVTEAALDAGYDSVEAFSRAFRSFFGGPPSVLGPALTDDQLQEAIAMTTSTRTLPEPRIVDMPARKVHGRALGDLVLVGEDEAPPLVHVELHVEGAILLQREQVMVGIHDLGPGGRLDHGSRHRPGLVDVQLQDALFDVVVEGDDQRLEVLNDLVDVLDDPLDGLVLVHHAVDPERPDRSATKGREQHPPYRVAQRVAEASLERLDDELSRPRSLLRVDVLDALWKHESVQIYLHIVLLNVPLPATGPTRRADECITSSTAPR